MQRAREVSVVRQTGGEGVGNARVVKAEDGEEAGQIIANPQIAWVRLHA